MRHSKNNSASMQQFLGGRVSCLCSVFLAALLGFIRKQILLSVNEKKKTRGPEPRVLHFTDVRDVVTFKTSFLISGM